VWTAPVAPQLQAGKTIAPSAMTRLIWNQLRQRAVKLIVRQLDSRIQNRADSDPLILRRE
jgi:hypothetical protein